MICPVCRRPDLTFMPGESLRGEVQPPHPFGNYTPRLVNHVDSVGKPCPNVQPRILNPDLAWIEL